MTLTLCYLPMNYFDYEFKIKNTSLQRPHLTISHTWLMRSRKSPCLIWNLSLDLKMLFFGTPGSLGLVIMVGHGICSNASSVMVNLSDKLRARDCFPYVKMWKATSDLSLWRLVINFSKWVAPSTVSFQKIMNKVISSSRIWYSLILQ